MGLSISDEQDLSMSPRLHYLLWTARQHLRKQPATTLPTNALIRRLGTTEAKDPFR